MMTDPIADMLARIRNAGMAKHPELVMPASNTKLAIARVLVEGGFLEDVRVEAREGRATLVVRMRYGDDGQPLVDGLKRVSRPGRRVYVGHEKIPRVRNGLGVAVISTSKGILSDRAAREASIGGEVLCEVW
ncbi:MAG: ribosomal protein S8p (S15Ae) [Deltaproteobacteria bacterium]|nr:ribosomal protein S8p (S15Ae) [Deltaproteobacteria bacterium]